MPLSRIKAEIERRHPALFGRLAGLRDRLAPFYAEPEIRLVPTLCVPGQAAFDIGANSGMYTYWMSRSAASVTAFEPNPHLADVLRRRFAGQIAAGRIEVETVALSDAEGEAELFVPAFASGLASVEAPGRNGLDGTAITVPRARLDRFDRGPVGFLKIDVEGHETAVVAGGLGLIGRWLPNILVEAEERHHPGAVAGLTGMLAPLGYRGFFLHGGVLRDIGAFDPAALQDPAALNAQGTHRLKGRVYVNNFLFVARDGMAARLAQAAARRR